MSTFPRVSIVVPLFDGADFIGETLRCVASQTMPDFEVLVVDDGSTDRGPDIVRGFLADTRLALVLKPHMGIARTRNVGAALSHPDSRYVIFLDQDDLWHPTLLERLVAAADDRAGSSGAYALADLVDRDGGSIAPGEFAAHMREREGLDGGRWARRAPDAGVRLDEVFLTNRVYPPSCLLIDRALFSRTGGFDPRYDVADDWDLVIRLVRLGPLVPVDDVLVGYRRHGTNASLNLDRNIRETRRVWATTYHSTSNTKADVAVLRATWRAHQRRTSVLKRRRGMGELRAGHVRRGIADLLDGWAHQALIRPPRRWALTGRPHGDGAEDLASLTVERGAAG